MAIELINTALYTDASKKSYYRLEGNSTDDWGVQNGTDTAITYSTGNGKFGQGAGFVSGTSSKIAINGARVGGGAAFSVAGWFSTSSTAVGTLYSEGKAGVDVQFVYISVNAAASGDFQFQIRDNADNITTMNYNPGAGVLNDGTFHHFVCLKHAANSWEMYVDGTSRATSSTNLSGGFTLDQASMGVLSRATDTNFYTGALDDVATLTRVLTSTEITNLYSGTYIPPQALRSFMTINTGFWGA